jgi:sigma-E factor negative regulatory protein RseA
MDGELPSDEVASLLDAMLADPALWEVWTVWHTGAASVRGEWTHAASGELAFWDALQKRLPVGWSAQDDAKPLPLQTTKPGSVRMAANEAWWRSRSLASIALVLMVGGLSVVLWPHDRGVEQAARPAVQVPSVAELAPLPEGATMLRNPDLDALMAEHQQLGGYSAWQAPSGFLRNATFESQGR